MNCDALAQTSCYSKPLTHQVIESNKNLLLLQLQSHACVPVVSDADDLFDMDSFWLAEGSKYVSELVINDNLLK